MTLAYTENHAQRPKCSVGEALAATMPYKGTTIPSMAKEKVTLTLDAENLAALRSLVGPRSLSASVDAAVTAHVARLRHLAAVDEWLAEMERDHGPVPDETLEWAARVVDDWAAARAPGPMPPPPVR